MPKLEQNVVDQLHKTLADFASEERQTSYKEQVPFVHVPVELLAQWDNDSRLVREADWFRALFTEAERAALSNLDSGSHGFGPLTPGRPQMFLRCFRIRSGARSCKRRMMLQGSCATRKDRSSRLMVVVSRALRSFSARSHAFCSTPLNGGVIWTRSTISCAVDSEPRKAVLFSNGRTTGSPKNDLDTPKPFDSWSADSSDATLQIDHALRMTLHGLGAVRARPCLIGLSRLSVAMDAVAMSKKIGSNSFSRRVPKCALKRTIATGRQLRGLALALAAWRWYVEQPAIAARVRRSNGPP